MGSKVSWNILGLVLASVNVFLALWNLHTGHLASVGAAFMFFSDDQFSKFMKSIQFLLPPLISLVISTTSILSPEFVAGNPNSAKFMIPLAVFLIINAYTLTDLYSMKSFRSVSNRVNAVVVSSFLFASASIIYVADDSEPSCLKSLKPWALEEDKDGETEAEDLYKNVHPGSPQNINRYSSSPVFDPVLYQPVYPPVFPSNPSSVYPVVY